MKKDSELIVTMNVEQLKTLIAESVEAALIERMKPATPLTVYPIKEAAEMLGVYPQTLRNYADKKLIKSFRVGNRYYFTLEEIQAFINKGGSTESTQ